MVIMESQVGRFTISLHNTDSWTQLAVERLQLTNLGEAEFQTPEEAEHVAETIRQTRTRLIRILGHSQQPHLERTFSLLGANN